MLAGLAGGLYMLMAGSALAFSLDDVAKQAQELASRGYEEPASNLPEEFRRMAFADYQRLRFDPEHAYWKDANTPFHLQFYHQGMHFDTPVRINEITATDVREIRYDPAMFQFDGVEVDPAALEGLLRRFQGALSAEQDKQDEVMTLLGASYFRIVGKGQWYGLSARGLAIDTALPVGEEFPLPRVLGGTAAARPAQPGHLRAARLAACHRRLPHGADAGQGQYAGRGPVYLREPVGKLASRR